MYRYASFKTREMLERYLEHGYAEGTISPSEFAGILHENNRWHLMLWDRRP